MEQCLIDSDWLTLIPWSRDAIAYKIAWLEKFWTAGRLTLKIWLCTTDIWPCVTNSWTAVIYLTPCRFKCRARSQTLNRGAMRSDLRVLNERNKATLSAWVTLSLCVFSFKLWYLLGRSLNLDLPMLLSLRNFCFLGGAYIGPNMDEGDDLVICNT